MSEFDREQWQYTADELGLTYTADPAEAFGLLDEYGVYRNGEFSPEQVEKLKRFLTGGGFFANMLQKLFPGVIHGRYQQHQALISSTVIHGGQDEQTPGVEIMLVCDRPLLPGLQIRPADGWERLKRFFGRGDSVDLSAYPRLQKLHITATDKPYLSHLLSQTAVQDALVAMYNHVGTYTVNEQLIIWRRPGTVIDPDTAEQTFAYMARLADALM